MKIEKLKPGMIVYDVGRQRMGNTTQSTVAVWPVEIVSVDADGQGVIARWNNNPARWCGAHSVSKWRAKRPALVKSGIGWRLARRGERPEARP